jgi:hypothetical protein
MSAVHRDSRRRVIRTDHLPRHVCADELEEGRAVDAARGERGGVGAVVKNWRLGGEGGCAGWVDRRGEGRVHDGDAGRGMRYSKGV